jgi:Flp pilus assembly secretin CpaC
MKKPRLCLALSASLALLQANLLPANSEPASPSIWQKLAGSADSKPAVRTVTAKAKSVAKDKHVVATKKSVGTVASARGVASNAAAGQVMLFLKTKEAGSEATHAPAAALTIHPALAQSGSKEAPVLVAMNDLPSPLAKVAHGSQLIAQLAPDQIIAQASEQTGGTTSTPIPPVVSGTVDLEEFKPSNVIDVKVSQSRTFKMKNKILRTSISDPAIAEPVVVAENQLVLLGKAPGASTLVIWDDAGNSVAVDVKVSRDYSKLQAMLRQIDPRIVVQPFSVGGSDRVLLRGDVDHPESVIRGFSVANAFMDDRGMKIVAANSRILDARVGEQGQGGGGGGGGQTGRLSSISSVDKYLYFSNLNNNVSRAQAMVSDGGRVASLIRVRKVPLIVLHCTFMEMNTAAVRELGVQLGVNFTNQSFSFGIGGQNNIGQPGGNGFFLTSLPGTNGTQGSTSFPFGIGSVNPVIGTAPAPGTGTVLNAVSGAAGANGGVTITPTFVPAAQNILGFIQQGMTKSAQFGATTAPVQFTAASVIPQLVGNQVINTPISQIGQAVFNQVPQLLGQAFLLGAPGGATFSPTGLGNTYTSTANFNSGASSRWSINPSVQGLISHSRARVLAEPTLVTLSGERAAFLAGGEIPLPQSVATAGTALTSVSFEPFGLRLNMIPVLMENGNINLQVSPEERIISNSLQFNLPGTTTNVPGFTTRKTQTVVELKPGQELYISGLVSANSGRELDKTPIVGEVPVLGALYRSKAFSKNESELVVAVRPEIILPGNPGQLKLPEEISKTEGPRDTNLLQVEPTIVDERYMTSGRAEHSQKLPGVLPPGAPIPDSQ